MKTENSIILRFKIIINSIKKEMPMNIKLNRICMRYQHYSVQHLVEWSIH